MDAASSRGIGRHVSCEARAGPPVRARGDLEQPRIGLDEAHLEDLVRIALVLQDVGDPVAIA